VHGQLGTQLARVSDSIRMRGVANTARLASRWGAWKLSPRLTDSLERSLATRAERRFDRRFGTETRSLYGRAVADAPAESGNDGKGYESTSQGALRLIVRSVTRRPEDWVFVDIGSGKGKVVIMAAALGFREAIGVEYSPSLARLGEQNVRVFRESHPAAPPTQLTVGDATEIDLPAGPLFVFLYNPFGEATIAAFLENLARSLAATPRPLVLAYLNPRHARVFDDCPFLRKTNVVETMLVGSCNIYQAISGAGTTP